MATWIAHMRIAEYFMNKYNKLYNQFFLVGNIAPDCGVPNENWSKFTPDKNITHWHNAGNNIDADDFKLKYLIDINNPKYPFYLGYYFHLITDIEWIKLYSKKKLEPVYKQGLEKNKDFIWTIKNDWYGQDHFFLHNNPNFIFFKMFAKINEFKNEFFDFYPDDAFTRQIKYITNFYLSRDEDFNRDFPFLSKSEMDAFVSDTVKIIDSSSFAK